MTSLPALALMVTLAAAPRAAAPDSAALARLLTTFLDGAGRPGAAVHERFWAEDLIYTGSSGRRVGKADILRDVRSAPPPRPGDPVVTYGHEDLRIQQYGSTALVAFRLVAHTTHQGRTEVGRYLNTGTFLKRGGEWRAVGWQATRVPVPGAELRESAAAAAEDFFRALAAADTAALSAAMAPEFAWTREGGARLGRRDLMEGLAAGRLRSPERRGSEVSLHAETAVVRTRGPARPGAPIGGRPAGVTHALTLARDAGGWRALALDSRGR